MKACLLILLLLPACVRYSDMYSNSYTSVGGDADVTFPGGGHLTHSHTASFQHFTQAAVAVIGGIAAGNVTKSTNANNNAKDLATQKETDATTLAAQKETDAATAAAAKVTQQTTARANGVPGL